MKHIMIDIETMGIVADSAIVSIGAILFDPRTNKLDKQGFYAELDWEAQDRKICAKTQEWWGKQSDAVTDALYGFEDLPEALKHLSTFIPKDAKVWGNGPTFDIIILEDAYRQCGIAIPWKFWNIRDCRTVKDMYESSRGGINNNFVGTTHNALHDAIFQAQYINKMWQSLTR